MIQITNNIQFDESKLLSEQTSKFQQWYNENVRINDTTPIDELDAYERPKSYTLTVEDFTVKVEPQYIFSDKSTWACSDFKITINTL